MQSTKIDSKQTYTAMNSFDNPIYTFTLHFICPQCKKKRKPKQLTHPLSLIEHDSHIILSLHATPFKTQTTCQHIHANAHHRSSKEAPHTTTKNSNYINRTIFITAEGLTATPLKYLGSFFHGDDFRNSSSLTASNVYRASAAETTGVAAAAVAVLAEVGSDSDMVV